MSITLSALKSGERSFDFEWEGETAKIIYRPNAYTPAMEQEISEKLEAGLPASSNAAILAEMLVSWEVTDDEGQELGTDYETVSQFPTEFLTNLLMAIGKDQKAAREDRKNLGAGSERKAGSGRARTGTR
jgi:hypothetical protein